MILAALAAIALSGCSYPASIVSPGGTPCDIVDIPVIPQAGRRRLHLAAVNEVVYAGLFCAAGKKFPDQCEGWRVPMIPVRCELPHLVRMENAGTINGLPVAAGCYEPRRFVGFRAAGWLAYSAADINDEGPYPLPTRCNATIPHDAAIIDQQPPWGIINGHKVKAGCYMLHGVR